MFPHVYIQVIQLWQGYQRCDASFFSLHPSRWYIISICPITDNVKLITWLRWGGRQNFRMALWPWPMVLLPWFCLVIWQKEDYLGGPSLITSALKKQSFLWLVAKGEVREMQSVTGIQLQGGLPCWVGENPWQITVIGLQDLSAAPSWQPQGNGDLSPTATRNRTLPTTWMSWKENSSPKPPDEIPAWPTPWFQSWETLSTEPSWIWQSCEIVSGCCFKPFVMICYTAVEN